MMKSCGRAPRRIGAAAMDSHFWDHREELLERHEWVKGAVNYDEDLHFSTFYLRASCARATGTLYPGYTAVVAFYSGCNETYYLLKHECEATAAAIVRKALGRPAWLPNILREIRRRSDALERVFPARLSAEYLARLADIRLLALYRRHAARQRALYHVARLPEALDRGVSYFSAYLKGYLRGLGLSESECEDTFTAFSLPAVPSVLAQELLEFDAIVRGARADAAVREIAGRCPSKVQLFLAPETIRRLDAHRAKWQYLAYHGYGKRELTTLRQYIDRLVQQLEAPPSHAADLLRRCADACVERQRLCERLPIDARHRPLLESYAEIGAVKLHRRYAQLRNFYGSTCCSLRWRGGSAWPSGSCAACCLRRSRRRWLRADWRRTASRNVLRTARSRCWTVRNTSPAARRRGSWPSASRRGRAAPWRATC
jgi:hypothetical protein